MPVIMLSKDFNKITLVKALTSGADDYLVKPFGKLEIAARVRAKLRRAYKGCLN
jgi:two-component system alkaline phosphatase synthesis response regulator PhoP